MLVFAAISRMVLLVACRAANIVLGNEILEQVEAGVPLAGRPSWRWGFLEPRVDYRVVLREHSAGFPNSRLRRWFHITHWIPLTLVVAVLLLAIWSSGRSHPPP